MEAWVDAVVVDPGHTADTPQAHQKEVTSLVHAGDADRARMEIPVSAAPLTWQRPERTGASSPW